MIDHAATLQFCNNMVTHDVFCNIIQFFPYPHLYQRSKHSFNQKYQKSLFIYETIFMFLVTFVIFFHTLCPKLKQKGS